MNKLFDNLTSTLNDSFSFLIEFIGSIIYFLIQLYSNLNLFWKQFIEEILNYSSNTFVYYFHFHSCYITFHINTSILHYFIGSLLATYINLRYYNYSFHINNEIFILSFFFIFIYITTFIFYGFTSCTIIFLQNSTHILVLCITFYFSSIFMRYLSNIYHECLLEKLNNLLTYLHLSKVKSYESESANLLITEYSDFFFKRITYTGTLIVHIVYLLIYLQFSIQMKKDAFEIILSAVRLVLHIYLTWSKLHSVTEDQLSIEKVIYQLELSEFEKLLGPSLISNDNNNNDNNDNNNFDKNNDRSENNLEVNSSNIKTNKNTNKNISSQIDICSICLSSQSIDSVKLSCGHIFHHHCIVKTLKYQIANSAQKSCPNCRHKL